MSSAWVNIMLFFIMMGFVMIFFYLTVSETSEEKKTRRDALEREWQQQKDRDDRIRAAIARFRLPRLARGDDVEINVHKLRAFQRMRERGFDMTAIPMSLAPLVEKVGIARRTGPFNREGLATFVPKNRPLTRDEASFRERYAAGHVNLSNIHPDNVEFVRRLGYEVMEGYDGRAFVVNYLP